jgi:hypothetical protein
VSGFAVPGLIIEQLCGKVKGEFAGDYPQVVKEIKALLERGKSK